MADGKKHNRLRPGKLIYDGEILTDSNDICQVSVTVLDDNVMVSLDRCSLVLHVQTAKALNDLLTESLAS